MNAELKNWLYRTLVVLVLTVLVALINRYLGVKVDVPQPPPLQVVIQPGPDKSDPFTGAKAFAVPVSVEK